MDYTRELQKYIEQEMDVLRRLDLEAVNRVMNELERAREEGRRIFVCGNGGSAATASHFCCDFNKGVGGTPGRSYNFECLSDNVPTMMAVANDIGYEEVFRFPLRYKMRAGDILLGISGSGNSVNVIRAMEYARSAGGTAIALVGYGGGRMKELADLCIHVAVDNMQIAEDIHMLLDHLMMYVLCGFREHRIEKLPACRAE